MSVFAWGENRNQELGVWRDYPNHKLVSEPVLVSQLEDCDVIQVEGGNGHTLVLNNNGEVFAFGRGQEGQLGLGHSIRVQPVPARVKDNGLGESFVVRICAGDGLSAAITRQGELFEWGFIHAPVEADASNPSNALPGLAREVPWMSDKLKELLRESTIQYLQGDGANRTEHGMDQETLDAEAGILLVRTRRKMRFVPMKSPFRHRVRDIALGYGHTLIVTETDGCAWTKGYNDRGQLGVGTRINEVDFVRVLGDLAGRAIKSIACGNSHNLAVTAGEGECWAWGSNVLGQLGISEKLTDQLLPARVGIEEPVRQVSAGSYHSVALSESRTLYTFGHAEYGQHGSDIHDAGDYGRRRAREFFTPRPVGNFQPGGIRLNEVRCGQLFTCGLDDTGALWTWGFGAAGNLGHGMKQLSNSAQRVEGLLGHIITQVSAGHKHVLALTVPEGHPYALKNQRPLADSSTDCSVAGKGRGDAARAHRALLFARCPNIRGCFAGQDRFELPLPVEQRVVSALLEFLYTDVVRSCPPHRLVDLQELASARYLALPRLEALCAFQRHQRKQRLGYNFESIPASASAKAITSLDQVPRTSFPEEMLCMLRAELCTDLRLASAQAADTSVGLGHTSFSWHGGADAGQVISAVGHTPFSLGTPKHEYRAHSFLLQRIPFFEALFHGHFKEESLIRSGETVRLDTVPDSHSLRRLLEWVYSGTTELSGDDVADVLRMASALGVDDLARRCEVFLLDSLDAESAHNILAIADETGLTKLARQCRIMLGMDILDLL